MKWNHGAGGRYNMKSSAEGSDVSTMEFFEAGFELGRLTGLCYGFLAGAGFASFLCVVLGAC